MESIDIKRLFELGYFFAPSTMQYGIETEAAAVALSGTDTAAKDALLLYQLTFKNELDQAALIEHNRVAIVDGELGPATARILHGPRCGYPDFLKAGDPLEGTHPETCRNDLTYDYSYQTLPGLTEVQTMRVHEAAILNWAADFVFKCYRGPKQTGAHRPIKLARLGRGVLADQYLAADSCGINLQGRFDQDRQLSYDYALAIDTHEFGHFLGLGHETADPAAIMYPSIHTAGVSRGGKPNATDQRNLENLGYERRPEQPNDPTDPEQPTDPPNQPDNWLARWEKIAPILGDIAQNQANLYKLFKAIIQAESDKTAEDKTPNDPTGGGLTGLT